MSPQTENRSIRIWSRGWFWVALLLGGAFVASANAVAKGVVAPYLERSLSLHMEGHLGLGGEVYLLDGDDALNPGNSEWEMHHPDAAIREWSKVVQTYGRSERSLSALITIGRAASHQRDRKAAIRAFTEAVDVPVARPRPPKRFSSDMDRVAFYQHTACVELSDLFLELQNPRSALKYAELAHDTYVFHPPSLSGDDCFDLEERINAIKFALADGQPILIEPRSTVLAHRYSARRAPPMANPVGQVK